MGRIPALDGLRGVAVLLVLFKHLAGAAPASSVAILTYCGGGLVGVQLFFALSGYLITSILLGELERTGRLDLERFWTRRIRRLYPALVATCLGLLAFAWLTGRLGVGAVLIDSWRALTYTFNFARPGGEAGWLTHAWSLAVEEQFYILWPLLALVAFRLWGRRGVGMLAIAGALAMIGARYFGGFDQFDLYLRLRWDALFIGCALAVFPVRTSRLAVGIAATVLAYYAIMPIDIYHATKESFTLTAIASGVLVIGARAAWLDGAALRYFGRISYGLYLLSYPIGMAVAPTSILAALVLSVAAADLSYRLIERRFWKPSLPAEARPSSSPAERSAQPYPRSSSAGSEPLPSTSP